MYKVIDDPLYTILRDNKIIFIKLRCIKTSDYIECKHIHNRNKYLCCTKYSFDRYIFSVILNLF